MKYTNHAGLPENIFLAISNPDYSRGGADISVTELIDSPRVRALKKKHGHEAEAEAEKSLAAFMGTCFHKGVERASRHGIVERRLSIMVDGWIISGGMDHYCDGVLTDYKTTNVFKASYSKKGKIESFEKQLNVYAHILRENGEEVKELKIWAWFLDWRNNEVKEATKKDKIWIPNKKTGYPSHKWLWFNVEMWEAPIAKEYVEARVEAHKLSAHILPQCLPEDIWGGRRCQDYCEVAPFCEQYQNSKKTGLIGG